MTLRSSVVDELDIIRSCGRQDAVESVASRAPTEPVRRMAWAAGYVEVDVLRDAVEAARAAGATWREVGEALGVHFRTAQSRFGGGAERSRRYHERQRAKGQTP